MELLGDILVLAQETHGGGAAEEESGNFLVSPNVGLMIWTLLAFGITLYLFEVGLVATLQAFIFATLSAIYIGGAVAESH
jgi:hypothetical protein